MLDSTPFENKNFNGNLTDDLEVGLKTYSMSAINSARINDTEHQISCPWKFQRRHLKLST